MHQAKKLINYGVIGAATTLINLTVYYVFTVFAFHYMVSNTVAFVISVAFAYVANKKWVFSQERVFTFQYRECLRFFGSRIFTLIAESVLLVVLITWVGWDSYAVKLFVTVFVIIVNYVMSEQLVFHGDIYHEKIAKDIEE